MAQLFVSVASSADLVTSFKYWINVCYSAVSMAAIKHIFASHFLWSLDTATKSY